MEVEVKKKYKFVFEDLVELVSYKKQTKMLTKTFETLKRCKKVFVA
jgi:hypothetical protein